MSGDIKQFIEDQRKQILEEKRRLGLIKQQALESESQKDEVKQTEKDLQLKNQDSLKSSNQIKENQATEEVKKPDENWVARKSRAKNNLVGKQQENRGNFYGKQGNCRNGVKKCRETTQTTKAFSEEHVTGAKENDAGVCNVKKAETVDLKRNFNDNNNVKDINDFQDEHNHFVHNSKLNNNQEANKVLIIHRDNNLNINNLNLNNENSNKLGDGDSLQKGDSELKLDLRRITEEDFEEEEKENINIAQSRCIGTNIGKDFASGRTGHADFQVGLFGAKSDASSGGHTLLSPPAIGGGEDNPMDHAPRSILRRGEYSYHNNRVSSASTHRGIVRAEPHCGLGEYELSRALFAERRRRDYLRHLAKVQYDLRFKNSPEKEYSPRTVTDELVDLAYRKRPYRRIDQRLTSAQNELLLKESDEAVLKTVRMDKPKSILSNRRTGSPRNRYGATNSYDDYEPSYTPSSFMDGFSYSDRGDDLERERIKRENYQHELRLQIEEKRRLQEMRAEQERRERDLENKRLEQQILRIREEAAMEDSKMGRRNELMRRHSDDLVRRNHELQLERRPWRRHADSESGALDTLGLGTSAHTSHYSPPVSRRVPYSFNVPSTSVFADSSSRYNPNRFESSSYSSILRNRDPSLNRMDAVNLYDTSTVPFSHRSRKFDRFDSLSRIDSLTHRLDSMNLRDETYGSSSARLTDVERRHSATQQDLSLSSRRSPRSRRRNSSSRFDDSLPIPVLKARSPVAKELKNAVPFSSARSSDSVHRRLEDRWQIPAVQKTMLHTSVSQPESPSGYYSRGSILTQLGAIRSQLQREQLRMDETLRRRGLARARSTDYGGY